MQSETRTKAAKAPAQKTRGAAGGGRRGKAVVPAWGNVLPGRSESAELKRGSIVREAAQCFNRSGFHATSMDEIAARLGVSKAALYRYVDNKHGLLYASFRLAMESSFASLDEGERSGRNGFEKLRITLTIYLGDLIGKLGHPVVLMEDSALLPDQKLTIIRLRDRAEKRYRALIEEGIGDGSIVPCNPKIAVFALLGAINWVPKWYRTDGELSADQVVEALVTFITRGMAPHPENVGSARRTPRPPVHHKRKLQETRHEST
jgi:TetR/AcrR family transcriptional regulator